MIEQSMCIGGTEDLVKLVFEEDTGRICWVDETKKTLHVGV